MNKKKAYAIFVIMMLIFWDLIDFTFQVLVEKKTYVFSAGQNLIMPLVMAGVLGYLLILRRKD